MDGSYIPEKLLEITTRWQEGPRKVPHFIWTMRNFLPVTLWATALEAFYPLIHGQAILQKLSTAL